MDVSVKYENLGGRAPVGRVRNKWKDEIKTSLKNMKRACELDLTGLGQGLTDSPCEHGNNLGLHNRWEIFDYRNVYQFFLRKEDAKPWS